MASTISVSSSARPEPQPVTSPTPSASGLPCSRERSAPSSSARSMKVWAALAMRSARAWAPSAAHAGCAARARATIAGISSAGVIGTAPTTSPVEGFMDSRTAVAVAVMGNGTWRVRVCGWQSGMMAKGPFEVLGNARDGQSVISLVNSVISGLGEWRSRVVVWPEVRSGRARAVRDWSYEDDVRPVAGKSVQ